MALFLSVGILGISTH